MLSPRSQVYEFGSFRLDCRERILSTAGAPVPLTDKVFDLLVLLVENRGHALGKAELMQKLWPDTVVEENNLTVNVSTLRKALGETASARRYIETLARRGYRFIAEVREVGAPATTVDERHAAVRPPARNERDRSPFVGREPELERLTRNLRAALAGRGRVVFITGDPGMGKTELCEQFLLRAEAESPAASIASGRCLEQYGAGEPYLPFLEAWRVWLTGAERNMVTEVLRRHAPSWCSQFPALQGDGELAGSAETRGMNAARMLREMGDALSAMSSTAPVVLLLEDMHWADPSSSDLLRLLATRAGSSRLLIIATLRAQEVELENHPLKNIRRELLAHDQCEEIALPLLDRACVARYLDARFGRHELPPEMSELISRTTEGQPLFATRLVQLMVDRGDIAEADGVWSLTRPASELHLAVPDGVRGVIEKKLESLSDLHRRTLQYASVVGVEFTSAMLATLLGIDEVTLEEQLDYLARRHRLFASLGDERAPDGRLTLRYHFVHVLYRKVLYEGLATKRRMLLHAQVAERLVADRGPDVHRIAAQLALHFEAAGLFERAIHHLQSAADNASRLHANREARQHYARALSLVKDLPPSEQIAQRIILHYNLGWASLKDGDATAGLVAFEAMLENARSHDFVAPGPEGERARDTVFAFLAQPWRDAFGLYDMPRMPNQDRSMGAVAIQCEALWALSYFLLDQGRLDEMRSRLAEYFTLAEASHNEPRRVEALAWMGSRELALGNLDEVRRILAEGIPAARAAGQPRALDLYFHTKQRLHALLCEFEQAEAMTAQSVARAYEAHGRLMFLMNQAEARCHLGRVSDALDTIAEIATIANATEDADELQSVANLYGWVYFETGAVDRAIAHFTHGAEICRAHGLLDAEMHSVINIARAHLALGNTSDAEASLERASALSAAGVRATSCDATAWSDSVRELRLQALRCELLLAGGDLTLALRCAEQLRVGASQQPGPRHLARARHLIARVELALKRRDDAVRELEGAVGSLGGYSMPLLVWKIATTLGFARLECGDSKGAREAFGRAWELVLAVSRGIRDDELRATWLSSRDVQRLRAGVAAASVGGPQAVADMR